MSRLGKLMWFAGAQGELGKAQIPNGPGEEMSRCQQAAARGWLPQLEPRKAACLGEAGDTGYAGSSCLLFLPASPSL